MFLASILPENRGRHVLNFAEIHDVPLGETHMLEQLPACMRQGIRVCSVFPSRESFQGIHEMNVRAPAF